MSDAAMDWRGSYQESLHETRAELRAERARGSTRRVDLPGLWRTAPVRELDDQEIEDVARDEARRDVERAINEWNERQADNRRRRRNGEGL